MSEGEYKNIVMCGFWLSLSLLLLLSTTLQFLKCGCLLLSLDEVGVADASSIYIFTVSVFIIQNSMVNANVHVCVVLK